MELAYSTLAHTEVCISAANPLMLVSLSASFSPIEIEFHLAITAKQHLASFQRSGTVSHLRIESRPKTAKQKSQRNEQLVY
jgi:hypothetical protein